MGKLIHLGLNGVSAASTLVISLLLSSITIDCVPQDVEALSSIKSNQDELKRESHTCNTDDLSHSVLVECNVTSCARSAISNGHTIEWPSQPGQILHVYSTRAGERFAQVWLPNIDFQEGDRERMLDINTTFYVTSARNPDRDHVQRHRLAGFGATLEFMKLERALEKGQFERLFGLIFDDLFGGTSSSSHLTLLRLQIDMERNEQTNLQATLLKLDNQLGERANRLAGRLKLMLDLNNLVDWDSQLKLDSNLTESLVNIEIWAVSIDTLNREYTKHATFIKRVREVLPDVLVFASVESLEAPYLVDRMSGEPASSIQGLMIRSNWSVPYNYLEYSRQHVEPNMRIITVGRDSPKTKNLGDWQNAQDSASELMRHLKLGSNGYIERKSVADILSDTVDPSDASLYSLHQDHGLHLRGPKFYALGHFSRYLKEGSLPLETELFTQPNMFAAHYSAFLSADRQYIVGIILNDNEHLLPFRLAIDRRIKLATNLEAKSFNTFLIKLNN